MNIKPKPLTFDVANANSEHFAVWSTTREGMSYSGEPGKAAFIEGGSIMLISKGCVECGLLPPGFVRYLTSDEAKTHGVPFIT